MLPSPVSFSCVKKPSLAVLIKCDLKICSKFRKEQPCQGVTVQSKFIEITLPRVCSPVNWLHIFGILFIITPVEGCFWVNWCLNLQISRADFTNDFKFTSNLNLSNNQRLKENSIYDGTKSEFTFKKDLISQGIWILHLSLPCVQLVLTILTGKDWCFTQFSTAMAGWLLLIFLICLHNQLSSIHSIISTDVWKTWFIK